MLPTRGVFLPERFPKRGVVPWPKLSERNETSRRAFMFVFLKDREWVESRSQSETAGILADQRFHLWGQDSTLAGKKQADGGFLRGFWVGSFGKTT